MLHSYYVILTHCMLFSRMTAALTLHIHKHFNIVEQRRYIRGVNAAVVEGEVSDEEVGRTTAS